MKQQYGTPHKDVCSFPQACEVNKCLSCLVHSLRYFEWQCHTFIHSCCCMMTTAFTLCLDTACTHALRTDNFGMHCNWLMFNAGSTRTRYLESAHQRSSDVRRTQQMTSDWTRSCTLHARSLPVTSPLLMQPAALCCRWQL